MTLPGLRRRSSLRRRPDRWSDMLRGAAVAVVAHGWQQTIDRQRHERLDRSAGSRTATIGAAMANYENALQAARSGWPRTR
jgi:hypothetical protein